MGTMPGSIFTRRSPQRLLVTGGAGFIGTNFVHYWCHHHPASRVVILDALTYAGNPQNLSGLAGQGNCRLVVGNICDRPLVNSLLVEENIDTVVHFAAESHVDRSILDPGTFVQTNVVGTLTLLEGFCQHWQQRGCPETICFLQVSTDEVYGSLASEDPPFSEQSLYAPRSPYAASKAGSDHLVRAYHHTYGLPTLITTCSNNYGPYQFPEKLIPRLCVNMLLGKPLPIYGDGQNIRDWLYVADHCQALDQVLHQGRVGETYNIGGNNPVKNLDLVHQLCDLMNAMASRLPVYPTQELITFVPDRLGHDYRYGIDASKIKTTLGWTPKETLASGLPKTIQWYLKHQDWWLELTDSI